MESTVIVAIFSLIGTILGSYFTGSKTTAVLQEKIKSLEDKVEKHNQMVERTYKLESDMNNAMCQINEIREEIHSMKK